MRGINWPSYDKPADQPAGMQRQQPCSGSGRCPMGVKGTSSMHPTSLHTMQVMHEVHGVPQCPMQSDYSALHIPGHPDGVAECGPSHPGRVWRKCSPFPHAGPFPIGRVAVRSQTAARPLRLDWDCSDKLLPHSLQWDPLCILPSYSPFNACAWFG